MVSAVSVGNRHRGAADIQIGELGHEEMRRSSSTGSQCARGSKLRLLMKAAIRRLIIVCRRCSSSCAATGRLGQPQVIRAHYLVRVDVVENEFVVVGHLAPLLPCRLIPRYSRIRAVRLPRCRMVSSCGIGMR